MTSRVRTLITVAGVGIGLAAAAGLLHARQTAFPERLSTERLLYLRSGRTADRLMLSFDALAADVYWIRTIQHYGRDRKSSRTTDRFALLYPLLDLTTTLDPHFNIAYRFGWIFLAMPAPDGPERPDLAIRLIEKGLSHNPTRWQYAYDAGFVHYWYTGDFQEAARWFGRAASMPGAPEWIGPLAATAKAQGGDRREARRMLESLLASEEAYVRGAAERGLAQLQTLDSIDELNELIEKFRKARGAYPGSVIDISAFAGHPGQIPVDLAGYPLVYDPATHTVSLSPESTLNPLPQSMIRR